MEAFLNVIKAQSQWVKDHYETDPEQAQQVIDQQIANINQIILYSKGATLNPTLTPPPPPAP